jgi:hypothetical protein
MLNEGYTNPQIVAALKRLGFKTSIRSLERYLQRWHRRRRHPAATPASLAGIANTTEGRVFAIAPTVSRQLRLSLRCYGNATTPLSTPALNHAANIISRHQRELRRRLLTIATSMTLMTLLTDLESLLESFLGKYRWFEPLP